MAESHSRTTVKSRLSRPLNGVIHQTQRRVSSEYPLPLLGDTMAAELGASYADSIVIAASLTPDLGKEMGTITHAQIPNESAQLASNWEHSTCDIGGVKFDSVQRTVIMRASAYSASSPAIGSALAANPDSAPNLGEGYVLADRQQVLSGSELEPVFRVERRNYVQKVTLSDVEIDEKTGLASVVETKLFYLGEIVTGSSTIQALIADPTNAYWAIREDGFARQGQQLTECWFQVVDRKIVTRDTRYTKKSDKLRPQKYFCPDDIKTESVTTTNNTPGEPTQPTASAGQSIELDQTGRIRTTTTTTQVGNPQSLIGTEMLSEDGTLYPTLEELVARASIPTTDLGGLQSDGTVVEYNPIDACDAQKVTKQAESLATRVRLLVSKLAPARFFTTPANVEITKTTGSLSAPATPAPSDGQQIEITQQGRRRITETTTQGTAQALKGTTIDPRTGKAYVKTVEVVAKSSVAATDVTDAGVLVEYDEDDATWSTKTTRQLADPTIKTWVEVINYEWPAVLVDIIFKTWDHKSGGSAIYPVPKFRKAYIGPQPVEVTQYWQKATPDPIVPVQMIEEGFQYRCPQYNISVPPCLHGEVTLSCTIGTEDPDWEFDTDTEIFAATNYTDWPDFIEWREFKNDRGGFLVTDYKLYKPGYTPPEP